MTDPTTRQPDLDTGRPDGAVPEPERTAHVREGVPDVPPPASERQSVAAIRSDIEETRSHLGDTIDELEGRVSPRQITRRTKDRARTRWNRVREQVMGSNGGDRTGSGGSASDTAREQVEEVRHKVEGQPLAAGLIAFGAGLLASALVPATKKEQDAAERLRDRVEEPIRRGVQEAGQEVKEDLTEQATERAKNVGTEAMAAAARTGSEAQDSAQRVSDDAKESAQQARS